MKSVSFHKIDAPESDYLYVEQSQIPEAGNGLFTAIDIYDDEMIAIFTGEILDDIEAENRARIGADRYFIVLPEQKILDSMNTDCFAKFANDAFNQPDLALKNNAKIAFDDLDNIGLIALHRIKAEEEIFCSYGKSYWKKWLPKI